MEPLTDTINTIFSEEKENVITLGRERLRLKGLIATTEITVKEMEAALADVESRLYKRMKEENLTVIGIDGVNFRPKDQYWASISMGDNISLKQIKNLGLEGLIKETVNAQTFSAEIRKLIDNGEIFYDNEENAWKRRLENDCVEPIAFSITKKEKIG